MGELAPLVANRGNFHLLTKNRAYIDFVVQIHKIVVRANLSRKVVLGRTGAMLGNQFGTFSGEGAGRLLNQSM